MRPVPVDLATTTTASVTGVSASISHLKSSKLACSV
jgi:hypothetical protein